MVTEAGQSANSIIARALEAAGVPPRNIELPADVGKETAHPNPYTPDGTPKGEVKGELVMEEAESSEPELTEPAESASAEKPTQQALSKAEIEAAINQASSKFQSIMDRKINQLQAQMTGTINALNQFFQAQETADISGLPENDQVLRRLERLEKGGKMPQIQVQQPIEQQSTQFYQQLVNFVDAVGLKVDDKRIDWAPDVSDPQTGFNRFLTSIKSALTEDQTKVIKELKENGDKEITKLRKKTGVDKVSTSGSSGAGTPDFSKMTPMEKIQYGYQIHELEVQQGK
uniref:Uncharacterized protein n=1 Tax=viral metagenome TaxID=1070528 RepID=A0A6M3JD50_9ZZZZ